MAAQLKVLLIGGYGFFGFKLAQQLCADSRLHLYIAGRSKARAVQAITELKASSSARLTPLRMDTSNPALAESIRNSGARIVVNVSGPFQGASYDVANACILAGANYIDLADSRHFVSGIAALDRAARAAGVFVISGASSVPAVSSAAVDFLATGFEQLHSIETGITPGNRTARGLATVRAILSYCGNSVLGWTGGEPHAIAGWGSLRRKDYPAPVGSRWLATCDVPDLELFPARYPGVQSVEFRAGLELKTLHFGLAFLSAVRRVKLLPNLSMLAGPLLWASNLFANVGSEDGAMHVTVSGIDRSGHGASRTWTLIARHGDGPFVPTLAAKALIQKVLARDLPYVGATPCLGLLSLREIREAAEGLSIAFATSDTTRL